MEEIATLLLNYGILGIIAIFYFKNNKEDREEKKDMHEKQLEQTERMICVIENNSSLIRDTKTIHNNLDQKVEEMKADIAYIKEELNKNSDKDNEILTVLNKLEENFKELISKGVMK